MCGTCVADQRVTSPVRAGLRERAARLDRVRDQTRLVVAPRHGHVGTRKRGVEVVGRERPDVAFVGAQVGVDERRTVCKRLLYFDDRLERLVVDLDQLRRVLRQRPGCRR